MELERVEWLLEQLVAEGRVVKSINDEGEIVYKLVVPDEDVGS